MICAFGNAFGTVPLVLLENRTGQVVSTGRNLLDVWRIVEREGAEFARHLGVVLDVQQLFKQTAGRSKHAGGFLGSLGMIPDEALRGFHIHHRHGGSVPR